MRPASRVRMRSAMGRSVELCMVWSFDCSSFVGWVERKRNPSHSRRQMMGFAYALPILRCLRSAYTLQKLQQRRIHLHRPLLLDPMAGAVDDAHQAKVGDLLAHHGDEVDARYEGEDRIEAAGDEGGRLLDAAVGDFSLLGEVDFGGAVAIEGSAKAATRELASVVVDVGRREPGRQRIGITQPI